jgi:hypothetical protein
MVCSGFARVNDALLCNPLGRLVVPLDPLIDVKGSQSAKPKSGADVMGKRVKGVAVEFVGGISRSGFVVLKEPLKETDYRDVMGNGLTAGHQFVIFDMGCLFALCLTGKTNRAAVDIYIPSAMGLLEVGFRSSHDFGLPSRCVFSTLPQAHNLPGTKIENKRPTQRVERTTNSRRKCLIRNSFAGVAEWQTRWTQNPVAVKAVRVQVPPPVLGLQNTSEYSGALFYGLFDTG